ncbi:SagB/ThcOx family dehydrogenase [Sporosalibacterium faouarense]|uniref:SagB/ThcOx family dehydrogenase n=1 Tax=Sporosalibacterium faouarense TaxID=516123 RepID=UPI001FAFF927|nr:SagB/ThcOx family dehydrogenase [Sporosalibacterium faouarense]
MKKIGQEFMEQTYYKNSEESDQDKGIEQPPLQLPYDEKANLIDLPEAKDIQIENISLRKSIERRKSLRKYSELPLTLEELSYLLWCTQGVKEIVSRPSTLRTVPSAGARHAFETYLMIRNVTGLKKGLYRYLAIEHKLVEVNMDEDIDSKVAQGCFDQPMMNQSAVTFIWSAVLYRMKWRYGERSYRYLHLDAGHVCQNLYLAAEDIDSGVCAIAAFEDEDINKCIGVDGEEQFVIYVATVGKRVK